MKSARRQQKILIVEDDRNTAALLVSYLEREGFQVRHIDNGKEALSRAKQDPPDLLILDIMLPGLDGWEICREVRKSSDLPILMLTAREEEIDRVSGFSLGADDYVVKPFSPREVVERVKAILRRSTRPVAARSVLSFGDLSLNYEKRQVTRSGKAVELTSAEYKLLLALMSSPGKAFSRNQLLEHIYHKGESVIERVVDVHIGHLRQKLNDNANQPKYIETVRGYGYRFVDHFGT